MKTKPKLQIALDTLTIEDAIQSVQPIKEYIDIIEVGTILLSSVGKKAISVLKNEFPDKIIVADGKIADAGVIFSNMFFQAGADFITCICAAETPTIKSCVEVAKKFGKNKEVQIELTSNFSWEEAKIWKELGVSQVVFHRSRDSQLAGKKWEPSDIKSIIKLQELGFKVTVTGGLVPEEIKLFKDLDIFIFVGGRSLRESENPKEVAKSFKTEIEKYWN